MLRSIAIYNKTSVHVFLIQIHKQLLSSMRINIALQAVLDHKLRLTPLFLLDLVDRVQHPLYQLDIPAFFISYWH